MSKHFFRVTDSKGELIAHVEAKTAAEARRFVAADITATRMTAREAVDAVASGYPIFDAESRMPAPTGRQPGDEQPANSEQG